MLDRRQFLEAIALLGLGPLACSVPRAASGGVKVNDIHSQLNETFVTSIHRPRSAGELSDVIRGLRGRPLALSGGRHAMGGQQFAESAALVDVRGMRKVLAFDRQAGVVEVEAGIEWPELISYLVEVQQGEARQWGIAQKQTGADRLTIAGSLAANVHGRGLTMKPFVDDVESFVLLDGSGSAIECSRSKNADLFSLAAGGYGLFGAVASVKLRLVPRRKVKRVVEVQEIDQLASAFASRIEEGFLYGDFQFSIDDASPNFLRRGVFSCYQPVADDTPVPSGQAELRPEDWLKLLYLAHAGKDQAYERYVGYYLGTSGQVYWSDEHQLSYYPDGYHEGLDRLLAGSRGSEMISELYVPRPKLADFMAAAAEDLRRRKANVVYGTVRLIERDDQTFLPWAKQPYACVIFNLHVDHGDKGKEEAAEAFRSLIDLALARDGNYYLTYHRWATRRQIDSAYPRFAEMLRRKRQFDTREQFQSNWYRHYRAMYGT